MKVGGQIPSLMGSPLQSTGGWEREENMGRGSFHGPGLNDAYFFYSHSVG